MSTHRGRRLPTSEATSPSATSSTSRELPERLLEELAEAVGVNESTILAGEDEARVLVVVAQQHPIFELHLPPGA
jgi:hypothetical protein